MKTSDLLVIDGYHIGQFERSPLLNNLDLYQYSRILWKPYSLYGEMDSYSETTQGVLDQALRIRSEHMSKWVEDGHFLFVVGPQPHPVVRQNSKGNTTTARVNEVFPFKGMKVVPSQGTRIEPAASCAEAFEVFLPNMKFAMAFEQSQLVPMFFAGRASNGPRPVVGGYRAHGKGKVFFIPECFLGERDYDSFLLTIAALPDRLERPAMVLPDWASAYRTDTEREIVASIGGLQQELKKIEAGIVAEEERLAKAATLKHLFAGTGDAFTIAVKEALEELGLTVTDGPNSRADLIAASRNRYLVVEAKGIEGSVKERQYRQVDRWMAELSSAFASDPSELKDDPELSEYAKRALSLTNEMLPNKEVKGLLIVGTYRNVPLRERIDSDFPDTVVRLLTRTDTCGLTGLQLYAMIMHLRRNPSLKETMVDDLLSTRGVLARGINWSEFLQVVE